MEIERWSDVAHYQVFDHDADFDPSEPMNCRRFSKGLLKKLFFQRDQLPRMRAWGLGVLPEYRSLLTAPALMQHAVEQGKARGVQTADVSWILESNTPMNSMLRAVGARRHKVHRVLQREPSK